MTSHQQEYRKLLSLTQSFLLTEFKSRQLLFTDPETYEYFKQYQPKAPLPKKAPPQTQQQLQQPKFQPPPQQQKKTATPPKQQPAQAPSPPLTKQNQHAAKTTGTATAQSTTKETPPASIKGQHFDLKLEPITEVKEIELSSIKKDFEKQFPDKQLISQPPDDSVAKKVGQQWKQAAKTPEVVILSFHEHPDRQAFLQNMKTAISQRLAPCVIYSAQTIESKNAWDKLFNMEGLRLIVTTDYGMYSMPGLMRYYRESPEKSQRYLGGVPVLLLTDIALYLKQPQLKSALWQALCKMLPVPQ
ncbi:MAG: hypothetical protein AAGG81_01710 [Chlamydiota bacterium]